MAYQNVIPQTNNMYDLGAESGPLYWRKLYGYAARFLGLSTSSAVVTDSNKDLVSMAYTHTDTANTIVSRNGDGDSNFRIVTGSIVSCSQLSTNTITASGTASIAGNLTCYGEIDADTLKVSTSGGTATALSFFQESQETLTYYDGSNYVDVIFRVARINSKVFVFVPSWSITTVTNNNQNFIGTTNYLPTQYRPSVAQWCDLPVSEGGTLMRGGILVNTNGSMELYKDLQHSNWANGTNGVPFNTNIHYNI